MESTESGRGERKIRDPYNAEKSNVPKMRSQDCRLCSAEPQGWRFESARLHMFPLFYFHLPAFPKMKGEMSGRVITRTAVSDQEGIILKAEKVRGLEPLDKGTRTSHGRQNEGK